jgi:hypothetical protein
MRQDTQDTTARTASSRFSTADFDCELPPGARAELLGKRLPQRATERQPAVWKRLWALLTWLSIPGVLVALLGVVLTGLHDQPATQNSATIQAPSIQPTPAPPASAATPAPPEHVVEQPILPPRAQLVRMPNPRESVPGVWLTGPAARAEPVAPVTVRRAEFMHPARHPVPAPPVSTPPQPEQAVYREWAGNGWVLADAQCVPLRGTFIADPAPRAELVSTAVCQP